MAKVNIEIYQSLNVVLLDEVVEHPMVLPFPLHRLDCIVTLWNVPGLYPLFDLSIIMGFIILFSLYMNLPDCHGHLSILAPYIYTFVSSFSYAAYTGSF